MAAILSAQTPPTDVDKLKSELEQLKVRNAELQKQLDAAKMQAEMQAHLEAAKARKVAGLAAAERFRGESSESTWLYSILLRKHLSRLRRPAPPLRRPSPLREPEVDEALALLADLPPAQKLTATLFYVEDLPVKEIARALSVTVATVKWRLFRVRRTLRRRLGNDSSRIVCKELR